LVFVVSPLSTQS